MAEVRHDTFLIMAAAPKILVSWITTKLAGTAGQPGLFPVVTHQCSIGIEALQVQRVSELERNNSGTLNSSAQAFVELVGSPVARQ